MKKLTARAKFVFLIAAMIVIATLDVLSQNADTSSLNISPLPAPTGFVNDYAGVVDPATKQALETKLKNFKDTTNPTVEIAVAVVKTTGGRDIFDYSLAVARGWKIGSKADDNPSALLFVAIDDRKYFTQVSKDLEDELPDGVVGSLQRQYLVPEFKKGNYAKGISDTVDAYIAAIQSKGNGVTNANTSPTPARPATSDRGVTGGGIFGFFCCGLIILIVLLVLFGRSKGGPTSGDRNRWGGGGFGSRGGGVESALPWIIGGIIGSLGSGGSGGSGGSSSDWGGGGSSGGGDFGGFGGGGDFGGGGAGGDW